MTQLDLAEHFFQLARHIMTVGVKHQPITKDRLDQALRTIYEAQQFTDAGKRTTGMALGLELLGRSMLPRDLSTQPAPKQPAPKQHRPIDEPPTSIPARAHPTRPISDDSLGLPCPQCNGDLYAKGRGNPLPVVCHKCGYEGTLP